ncbi:putative all-trans-retinol 13,14-reductase [Oryzias melastigma]|uniref:Putative all-trans-retinol 13,14-reductase n=1 Tax=Oryzias melastigma TaxID=30732 RepID=A0A834BW04_ORYME|nr:putative all-trans-retinol 13,14-reductase [Oryzias melastigma]
MIPIVEKAGGAVLVRAPVNRILFNSAKEACGLYNTYEKLLPKELQAMPAIQKQLSMVNHGGSGLSIFLGLNGTKEELGLKADNYWIFSENNYNEMLESYFKEDREESSKKMPVLFASSPSAKDSTWNERSPGKSTLTLVSFAPYEWFEEWKDEKVTNRSAEYKALKQKIEYVDAGTPLTNMHYIAAPKGEVYGIDHGMARFNPEFTTLMRPQTPLKNLYLTGQDLFTCGFGGALAGALSCGSVILNRNLHLDAIGLAKRMKYLNKKLKGE